MSIVAELPPPPPEFQIETVSRSKILEMVKEEQRVRYSKGIQEAYTQEFYTKQSNPNYQPVRMERQIQKYILRTFGFKDDDFSLAEYWRIPSTYWNDEEVKNSIFYMKLNIFQFPKIQVGDDLVNVSLVNYSTRQAIQLSSLQQSHRPLVLLAGSMT